jgi:hypothetical protein
VTTTSCGAGDGDSATVRKCSGDVDPDELDSFFALMRIHDTAVEGGGESNRGTGGGAAAVVPAKQSGKQSPPSPAASLDFIELKNEVASLRTVLHAEAEARRTADETQRQTAAALRVIMKQQEELHALMMTILPRADL